MRALLILFTTLCGIISAINPQATRVLSSTVKRLSPPTAKSAASVAALRAFNNLKGYQLFASADYNLDKISDLLFHNITEKGTDITALCRLGEDGGVGADWIRCSSSSVPIKSTAPVFIRPMQLDNGMIYIALETRKALSKSDRRMEAGKDQNEGECVLTSYIPGFRDLAKSPYDYDYAWSDACDCEFRPIFMDLNFDGITDMLVMVDGKRVGYLASGLGDGRFVRKSWSELNSYFDLVDYSSRDRFPIDQDTVKNSAQYLALVAGEDSNSLTYTESSAMRGILSWLKSWVQEPSKRQVTIHSLQEHFIDFKSNTLQLLYYQENEHQWLPRPLPLSEPSIISAKIPGALEVDMDGDCQADLVFIIESPDFQGRHELEVWLTEPRSLSQSDLNKSLGADRIRRLWRSQRLLLPEGLISVGLSDLFNSAGADIIALANGGDGVSKLYTFRMLHEIQAPDSMCKSFHFSYGGLNGRVEREFMTISPIEGQVFLPNLFLRDIDGDRYEDVVLVMSTDEKETDNIFLRVFNSAGTITQRASPHPVSTWKDEDTANMPLQAKILYWFRRLCAETASFVVTLTSPKKMWQQIWTNMTGAHDRDSANIVTRSFERSYDLHIPGTFHIDRSTFGWLDPSTFVAWNGESSASQPITMFPQTGARGELGFFTRVKVYGAQCVPNSTGSPPHRSAFPMSGAVVSLAPPGMDGKRLPVRRTQSSIDSHYLVRPASLIVGFGDSSNYIDAVTIGVPYTRYALRTCGDSAKEIAPLRDPSMFRKVWSAIMPNSELLIELPSNRWETEKWRLTLIVAPGRQVIRVVVAMMIALVVVGLYNLALARRAEERRMSAKGY